MTNSFPIFAALAVAAGVSFVFQQAVNADLRTELGYPFWAGLVSYAGGTLCMLVMMLATREPLLSFSAVARTSPLSWTGGLFGAIYIAVSIYLLPKMGAAPFLALLVLGQMIASMAFDHYGLLGVAQQPISTAKLVGTGFLVSGVLLVKL